MSLRLEPHQINPLDPDRAPVAAGEYVVEVDSDGRITGLVPAPTSSGGVNKDRRWTPGPAETSIDEFNDDTLDAAWVRVDAAGEAGHISWAEGGDSLSMFTGLSTDATAELHGLVQPLSGIGGSMVEGDAFRTHLTWDRLATFGVAGLILSDGTTHGAGAQIMAAMVSANSTQTLDGRAMTNWNTAGTTSTSFSLAGNCTYIQLVKLAGTSWRFDISPDDVQYVPGPAFTSAITPTHVGFFGSSWNNSTDHVFAFEFLRRVSGVT